LQDEVDATTILVTHDPEEAFLLADDLILLEAGSVVQTGPVNAVFARPANAAMARLLGAQTIADGLVVAEDMIEIAGGLRLSVDGPPLPLGAAVGWSVRADRLRIVHTGGHPCTIVSVRPAVAGRQELRIRLGAVSLRVMQDAETVLQPGPARLAVPPSAMQVWPIAAAPIAEAPGSGPNPA
jgi:ABC-type sulfate/molybdate transport systems ATPase subunit